MCGGANGKEFACQRRRHKRHGFDSWVRKSYWKRKWQPTLVFLPEKSHGKRSPVGHSPWGYRVRHDWARIHSLDGNMCMETKYSKRANWKVPGKHPVWLLNAETHYEKKCRSNYNYKCFMIIILFAAVNLCYLLFININLC